MVHMNIEYTRILACIWKGHAWLKIEIDFLSLAVVRVHVHCIG